ncbi:hypothetical protein Salmuc_03443 [Salipiger mucosus DSM 16094]|uniref:Uncharacterized protein n=1 Tax=Salipiger mucosus DSM 16094 TaxID=1123237 RepID=S9RVV5_9RHOB|nr:hypothetical protein Salmuc_03443 [Salipiger mucosus DSM 16094]
MFSMEEHVGPNAVYDAEDLAAQLRDGADHLANYMEQSNEGNIFAASAEARAAVHDYDDACIYASRIATSMAMNENESPEMRELVGDICEGRDAIVAMMEQVSGPIQQLLSIRNAAQIKVVSAAEAFDIEPRYDVRPFPDSDGGPAGPTM